MVPGVVRMGNAMSVLPLLKVSGCLLVEEVWATVTMLAASLELLLVLLALVLRVHAVSTKPVVLLMLLLLLLVLLLAASVLMVQAMLSVLLLLLLLVVLSLLPKCMAGGVRVMSTISGWRQLGACRLEAWTKAMRTMVRVPVTMAVVAREAEAIMVQWHRQTRSELLLVLVLSAVSVLILSEWGRRGASNVGGFDLNVVRSWGCARH